MLFFVKVFRHIGTDKTRCNGIYSYFFPSDLLGQCLGGPDHACLCCAVIGLPGHAIYPRQGNHINDASEFVHDHILEQGAGNIIKTVQVGVDDLTPLLRFHPDHQVIHADPGIVYQDLYISIILMLLFPTF